MCPEEKHLKQRLYILQWALVLWSLLAQTLHTQLCLLEFLDQPPYTHCALQTRAFSNMDKTLSRAPLSVGSVAVSAL